MIRLGNKGDTVIEVLVAVAVVGAVLSGAFVSANRSSQITRMAQERGEAIKLAETQIERIKYLSGLGTTLPGGNFCFPSGTNTPSTTVPCNVLQGITYRVTVGQPAADRFSIVVRWDAYGGGENQVELGYRVK